MNLEQILTLLQTALNEAEQMNIRISVAFMDKGGHLRALLRMDDACWGDIDLAVNKAYTAAAWQTDSGDFYIESQPGGAFYGLHFSNEQRVTTFPGGMPVYQSGQLIGAIGVSGGTPKQDQCCLDAVKNILRQI